MRLPPPPSTGKDERVYAIGDVHGRLDLLVDLLKRINLDDEARAPRRTRRLLLGDFIDRGPDTKEIVALLRSSRRGAKPITVLMGNHEAALLDSISGHVEAQEMWLRYGGQATLESFGITAPEGMCSHDVAKQLKSEMPADMIQWLKGLPLSVRCGDYFFCHAGVRPGVPLRWQHHDDLLWIRNDFLNSDAYHGAVIVHGHTICGDEVEMTHNRINVDTGAYKSGILSAIALEGSARWVISTRVG